MTAASRRYNAVSDEQCSHCLARLGAGRGRCWWCFQAWADADITARADRNTTGQRETIAEVNLRILRSWAGVFFVP